MTNKIAKTSDEFRDAIALVNCLIVEENWTAAQKFLDDLAYEVLGTLNGVSLYELQTRAVSITIHKCAIDAHEQISY